jgi:hypothetical protein
MGAAEKSIAQSPFRVNICNIYVKKRKKPLRFRPLQGKIG